MPSVDANDENMLLRRRIAELETSEVRYRSLFENSPVPLWEEDWSVVNVFLNNLLASGVTDLDGYFRSHFDDVIACMKMVKVTDVNKAALELCRATSKEQLLAGLHIIFNDATMKTFQNELVALGQGAMLYEEETVVCTLDRDPRNVLFRIAVSDGYEETWERCIISLMDITDRRRAEDALRSSNETILAQRTMLAKLSTPVIPISEEVIVMPLIGALDTMRMQQVMSALLDAIQRSRASIAILDITGVLEIDMEATNGIIRAAQAVRMLGAQVVLTGIRSEIARSLVELGSNLQEIVTRGTLQAGIAYAIRDGGSRR